MTVYFAQARTDTTTVKIGFTSDLVRRKGNMSTSTPGGVSILASLPGNKETEEYLHEKFAAHRIGGEWFTFAEPLREFINDLKNGKQGLIPFRDTVVYMRRSYSEYADDAISAAREMTLAIVNAEFRGIGDTIGAAMHRVAKRTGIRHPTLFRIVYRPLTDIRAGEYLHLKDVYEELNARKPAAGASQ